jgi:hypothetical protein
MSQQPSYQKILDHIDRDEIISKLCIGIEPQEIYEWLADKYSDISQKKFVLTVKVLKSFKDTYLDFYTKVRDDVINTKRAIQTSSFNDDIQLTVANNPAYKDMIKSVADTELNNAINIKKMLANMIVAVENRTAQLYDLTQEQGTFDTRTMRVLGEWFELLGSNLERWHKIVEGGPDQIIQHNVSVQHNLDQYTSIFYNAIRETLSQMDTEAALVFMEKFNSILDKVKLPTQAQITQEQKTKEIELINQNITQTLLEAPNA